MSACQLASSPSVSWLDDVLPPLTTGTPNTLLWVFRAQTAVWPEVADPSSEGSKDVRARIGCSRAWTRRQGDTAMSRLSAVALSINSVSSGSFSCFHHTV